MNHLTRDICMLQAKSKLKEFDVGRDEILKL